MPRALLLLALLTPLSTPAEVLTIPVGQQGDTHQPLPVRGQTQRAVLDRFGLADKEHPAVGKPPITRWDYREFSVYFESGVVVDSVLHHQPRNPIQPPASAPQHEESP
ncbi:phosphodiesterase [Zestomonas insulae]|uniref:phosphodiesterase n=1 Tax=Zestomonas insulae TaxID=2809017 RepID=UPI003D2D3F86